MKNGVTGTFCVNGDSVINDQAVFTIYGKKGILKLVDPNNFGGDVVYIPGVKDWTQQTVPEVLHYGFDYSENSRVRWQKQLPRADQTVRVPKWHITYSIRSIRL